MDDMNSMIEVEEPATTSSGIISSMTPPASSGPSMKSNKSSLSSSTSSLVSITSTSTTPIVFAPPPTPLSSSAAPTPVTLPPLLQPATSSQQTIPIYQLNQSQPQSSSYADCLIDGTTVSDRFGKYPSHISPPLPPPPHLSTLISLSSTFNSFMNGSNVVDDSSSPSNRRECKVCWILSIYKFNNVGLLFEH